MTTEPRRKLRIGLLQDSVYANRYLHDLVTWAAKQEDLEIRHLFVHEAPEEARVGTVGRALLRGIRLLEQPLLRLYPGSLYREHMKQLRIDPLMEQTLHLRPFRSSSGYQWPAEEAARVRSMGCDVLILSGGAVPEGKILEAAPFGTLSLSYGDTGVSQGDPAAFWECYLGRPATGFVIQRLTTQGREVLLRGSYETKWFYLLNQAALFSKSNVHLKDLLKKLARERRLPPAEPPLSRSAELASPPSGGRCLHYLARLIGRSVRKGLRYFLRLRSRWSVSFSFTDWSRTVLSQATTTPPPPGRFLADPFVWQHQGKTYCLVEDYSYRDRIARISALEVGREGATAPVMVLAEPFHLSFPYLFQLDGTTYMCPESSASGQIRLYRSVEFPYRWEFVKAIMTGVSAYDSMLFQHGDRWWMLTNLDRSGEGGFVTELYLYWADSPLSESWQPHPSNPLKIDALGGRNAGLLRDGERLFRAGQVHGFDRYGVAIRLYEIDSLSPEHYAEHLVAEIQPDFQDGIERIHHMSSSHGVTAVDVARREFVW
jgi:hypothetical protein